MSGLYAGQEFLEFLDHKNKWSIKTFGPDCSHERICRHIEREVDEIRKDPVDVVEWVDVILLALDGAMRAGYKPEEIWETMLAKQRANEARKWPPIQSGDEPMEHIR